MALSPPPIVFNPSRKAWVCYRRFTRLPFLYACPHLSGVALLSSSQTLYRSFPCKARKVRSLRCSSSPQKVFRLFGNPGGLRRVISQSDGHSVVKRCRETISLHLFGLGKEKLSGVLETKNKISPHSFGQRGSKCTPKICALREKTPKKFILSLVPTGRDEMDTLFLKNFCPLHLFEMGERFWGVFSKN